MVSHQRSVASAEACETAIRLPGRSRSAIIVASANGQPVWRRNAITVGSPNVTPGSGGAVSPGDGGAAVGSARGGTNVRRFTRGRLRRCGGLRVEQRGDLAGR